MAGCLSLVVLQLATMINMVGMNYSWTDCPDRGALRGDRPWKVDDRAARSANCATRREPNRRIRPWSGPSWLY